MSTRGLWGRCLYVLAVSTLYLSMHEDVFGLPQAAPLAPGACSKVEPASIVPDRLFGVRTKFQYVAGNDHRHSIAPDLQGLPLPEWTSRLERAGVNVVDLNLEPRTVLQPESAPSDATVAAYAEVLQKQDGQRTADDRAVLSSFEDKYIPDHMYTVQQQQFLLEKFLQAYEKAYELGQISGKLRFIVHQRVWFRPGDAPRQRQRRDQRSEQFAEDMSGLINRLRAQGCLDHWVLGVRLGENGNPNMPELMPVIEALAAGIDARTHGWMSRHLFVSNGGGMGAEYLGLEDFDRAGGVERFLRHMSRVSGAFAFGYKWMRFVPTPPGQAADKRFQFQIRSQFEDASCAAANPHPCRDTDVADWTDFLGRQLGFEQLKTVFTRYHARFPSHANVIFVGDNSDALYNLTTVTPQGLVPDAAFEALRHLWPSGTPGWCGRQYLNGYMNSSTGGRAASRAGSTDDGLSLFFINAAGQPDVQAQTRSFWESFPCATQ